MAKINFGTIVNDARGKVAGVVMSKNKSGSYVRTKVTPTNPRTPSQQAARSNFGSLAQAWSGTLTASERAQWVAYAQTYPRTNIFGNSITLNGMNMYLSLGTVMLQAGQVPISTPPPSNIVAASVYAPAWSTLTTLLVKYSITALSTGPAPFDYIFATKSLPAGRAATSSDYRLISINQTPAVGVNDITASYVAKFGAPIVGQNVYGLIATLDSTTGLLSLSQPVVGVVT